MAELTQSQQAAYDTEKAINEAAFREVATSVKQGYSALATIPGVNLGTPDDPAQFNAHVESLSHEIIAGETERAKKIRAWMKEQNPEQFEKLEKLPQMRQAAVQAVYDNTGDYEMLQGSTVGNALGGLFSWLFKDGIGGFFQKVGQLLSWAFGGERPPGLVETISERATNSATEDFKKNLQAQGIDPATGVGQEAVTEFQRQARIKAGLETGPAPAPFDLNAVQGGPPPKAPTTDVSKVTDKESAKQAAAAHLDALAGQLHTQLNGLLNLQPALAQQYGGLLEPAKKAFAAIGTKLAQGYIDEGKPLPPDFEFQVMRESFREVHQTLPTDADPKLRETLRKTVAAFEVSTSLADVSQKLKSANDPDAAQIPTLLDIINTNLRAGVREGAGNLQDIVAKALPDTPETRTQLAEAQARQVAAAQQDYQAALDNAKSTISAEIDKKINKAEIRAGVDAGVGSAGRGERAVGWLLRAYPGESDYLPYNGDRDKLTDFLAERVPHIAKNELNKLVDGKEKQVDVEKVVQQSLAQFDTAFDAAIQDGTIPSVWQYHKDKVRDDVEARLRKTLEENKGVIDGLLQKLPMPPAVTAARTGADPLQVHHVETAVAVAPMTTPAGKPGFTDPTAAPGDNMLPKNTGLGSQEFPSLA